MTRGELWAGTGLLLLTLGAGFWAFGHRRQALEAQRFRPHVFCDMVKHPPRPTTKFVISGPHVHAENL